MDIHIVLPNKRSSEDTGFVDGLVLTALEEKLKGFGLMFSTKLKR